MLDYRSTPLRQRIAAAFIAAIVVSLAPHGAAAESRFDLPDAEPIAARHVDASRAEATTLPRSEGDQALVAGWPLYRSERGQEAFNRAMATLGATDSAAPDAAAFKGCKELDCAFALPPMRSDGWLPAGRIWISPTEYVLLVDSPRPRSSRLSRHTRRSMRYFVLHEFRNGTRNTDVYDTISSHSGSVFVAFYMSKTTTDAHGRRFVTIVQVAPYNVRSVHATNLGSAGPGIEVAKNTTDDLEPLQALAGIVVSRMVVAAAPYLKVVNHRGDEGLPMLEAYQEWLEARTEDAAGSAKVVLPFVPAAAEHVASARQPLAHLIRRKGLSPPLTMAERTFVPPRPANSRPAVVAALTVPVPVLVRSSYVREASDVVPVRVAPVRIDPLLIEPIERAAPPAPACNQSREGIAAFAPCSWPGSGMR